MYDHVWQNSYQTVTPFLTNVANSSIYIMDARRDKTRSLLASGTPDKRPCSGRGKKAFTSIFTRVVSSPEELTLGLGGSGHRAGQVAPMRQRI